MRFSRILKEKEFLKLGRQVKGAEIPHLHFKEPAEIEIPNAVAVFEASTQIPGNEAPVTRGDDEPLENLWFKSKVVSRVHAEIWLKGGHVYLKDIGSSSGTFLNKLRLSPAGKRSRPYPIKNGDIIQMGVDYQGRAEG